MRTPSSIASHSSKETGRHLGHALLLLVALAIIPPSFMAKTFATLPQSMARAFKRCTHHLPFTLLIAFSFLILSFLTRLVLMSISISSAEASLSNWSVALLMGIVSDIATLSFALLPIALFDLFLPRKLPRISTALRFFAFFIVFFSLIFLAASEFTFWQEFGTRFNFIAVDYLIYTQEVMDNIFQSYPVKSLLSLFALTSIFATYLVKSHIKGATSISFKKRFVILGSLIILCIVTWVAWTPDKAAVTKNQYTNELAQNGLYNFFSAFRNNELDYTSYYPVLPEKNIQKILVDSREYQGDARLSALPKKPKHIIMITVESLSGEYLNSLGGKMNITPHLDQLAQEGLSFTNLYAVGTRTVRGLEALSLATPPTPGQSIVRRPKNEDLATLGSALNRHGFHSHYLYGGYGYFDNMNYYFSQNGYEVTDRSDIPKADVGFANAWGVADEYLFNQAEKMMDKSADHQSQFFMIMTTSNHRPYTYPDNRIDIPSPGGRMGAVKYTDYAINKFIQDAKKKPWFKDTLFVIIADHCASSAGKTSLPINRYHIPAIFYAPDLLPPSKEERLVSQIDIPATLLAMLGLPAEPHFAGVNVWKNANYTPRAFIANYQELGYLKDNHLVVLAPHHPAKEYRVEQLANQVEQQTEVTPNPQHVAEAIAYYQKAAENFHNGAMKLTSSEIPYHAPERQ